MVPGHTSGVWRPKFVCLQPLTWQDWSMTCLGLAVKPGSQVVVHIMHGLLLLLLLLYQDSRIGPLFIIWFVW
jgi:hypothetical protein